MAQRIAPDALQNYGHAGELGSLPRGLGGKYGSGEIVLPGLKPSGAIRCAIAPYRLERCLGSE